MTTREKRQAADRKKRRPPPRKSDALRARIQAEIRREQDRLRRQPD